MARLFKCEVRWSSSATTEAWVAWIFTISCVDIMRSAQNQGNGGGIFSGSVLMLVLSMGLSWKGRR